MASTPTTKQPVANEAEAEAPAEEQGTMSKAPISEEFQARTIDHLGGANEDELGFVRDQVFKHEEKLRQKKEKKRELHHTDDDIGAFNAVKNPED